MPVEQFNPFAYMADVHAHPEKYSTMASVLDAVGILRKMRSAADLKELEALYKSEFRNAKAAGMQEYMALLVEAKDARKKALEAV